MIHVWNKYKKQIFVLSFLSLTGFLLTPLFIHAAGYISLVGVPGLENSVKPNMQTYVDTLMKMAIIAAALVAVIKLIMAGAKYVLSGIVTDKESAKKDIYSALLGLLIILAAVTVLTTINPQLTNLKGLDSIDVVIPPTPDPKKTDTDTWCEAGGGCDNYTCDGLDDYFLGIMASGGVIGGAAAIAAGIATGPVSLLIVALGTGYSAYLAADGTNSLACEVKCSSLSGRFEDNVCRIPIDTTKANIATANKFAEEQDAKRAEEKKSVAENTPKTDKEVTDYFGLPVETLTDKNFGQPVNSIADINQTDKNMLFARYNIKDDSDTDRVKGKFTIVKSVINSPESQNEYNIMLANIETSLREKCTSGSVEKISLSEHSNASVTVNTYQTVYYCITPK